MSKEILNLIDEFSQIKNAPYIALFSKENVSDKNSICINSGISNCLNELDISVKHKNIDFCCLSKFEIILPPKERFFSNSNYNHAVLHEFNHRISVIADLSSDYTSSYLSYKKEYGSAPDFDKIVKSFQENCQDMLNPAEKCIMAAYSKDETAVELSSYMMMKKIGIEPDKRDTAYTMWNIAENNKTLEKLGIGFARNMINLSEIYKRTDRLLSASMETYEKVNHIKLENNRQKEREKER